MESNHLKAIRLRIGNRVLFGDISAIVVECREHPKQNLVRIEYLREDIQAIHRPCVEESLIFPMPLTIDKILAFGFELNSDEGDCKFYEQGKYGIRWVDGDEFYFYLKINNHEYWILKEIHDVHELQNIWVELTKEELI